MILVAIDLAKRYRLCYTTCACAEDRATLASDLSAATGGHTAGQGWQDPALPCPARLAARKAINASNWPPVGALNYRHEFAQFCEPLVLRTFTTKVLNRARLAGQAGGGQLVLFAPPGNLSQVLAQFKPVQLLAGELYGSLSLGSVVCPQFVGMGEKRIGDLFHSSIRPPVQRL